MDLQPQLRDSDQLPPRGFGVRLPPASGWYAMDQMPSQEYYRNDTPCHLSRTEGNVFVIVLHLTSAEDPEDKAVPHLSREIEDQRSHMGHWPQAVQPQV